MKYFIIISLFATFFISCSITGPSVSNKKINKIKELNSGIKITNTLGINDLIEVRVYGEDKLTRVYRINTSGIIFFPMIGSINVIDRTPLDIANEIEQKLKKKIFKNPQVTIFLKEFNSKKVYILGQVKNPGAYSYKHNLTLLKLIATSGGLTNIANIDNIILKREIKGKVNSIIIEGSLMLKGKVDDLLLSPEDIIYVPESWL